MIKGTRGMLLSLTLMISLGSVQQTYPGNLGHDAGNINKAELCFLAAFWLTKCTIQGVMNGALVGGVGYGLHQLGYNEQPIPWYQKFLRGATTGVTEGLKWGAGVGLVVGVGQIGLMAALAAIAKR